MKDEVDFTKQMEELEAITAWFESDKVDLTQALGKFERGMVLITGLREQLAEVENKVEKIKQRFDKPSDVVADAAEPEAADPELFP